MRISVSPQRRDGALTVQKTGDILVINNEPFDFSSLPDGATIPAGEVPCEWIAGPVSRVGGHLHLTLVLPHGPSPSEAVAFPAQVINPPDGLIALPFDPATEEETGHVDA